MTRNAWTAAEDKVIINHPLATVGELAEMVPGHSVQAIKKRRSDLGRQGKMDLWAARRAEWEARVERARALREEGRTQKEIAVELGVCVPTVRKLLRARGVSARPEGASWNRPVRDVAPDACSICGRRHRAGKPKWLALAIQLYGSGMEGIGCPTVAQELERCGYRVTGETARFWLRHEGVQLRNGELAAHLAARNRGFSVRKKAKGVRCQCGRPDCTETASGIWYPDPDNPGKQRQSVYAPGHQSVPGPRASTRSGTFSRWLEGERLAQGWTLDQLGDAVHLSPDNLMSSRTPRPRAIYFCARGLKRDVMEVFVLAGATRPCQLGLYLLEYMWTTGRTGEDIIDLAKVGRSIIDKALTREVYTPYPDALNKLEGARVLTREQVQSLEEGRSPRAARKPESYDWHRRQVDEDDLRHLLLVRGLTYAQAAQHLGVSYGVVYARAGTLRIGGAHLRRLRARRDAAAQSEQLNDAHQKVADERLEIAQQILIEADDDELLRLTVRKLQDLIRDADGNVTGKGVDNKVASEMLRTAKVRARAHLTIAS